jgi:DNA-binding transcriptional LysR family regulator
MGKLVRVPELAELRAFCAAVDLGSIGRAARLLRVSQPALSKRLRTLEAVAGSRLLERSPRGVTPTSAGTKLYLAARKVLAEAEAVEALMSGLSADEPPVRLGASPTIAEFVLPGLLVDLEREHERHLSVELAIGNSSLVRELVREGRADVGVAAGEPLAEERVLVETRFCEDEVVVAVPRTHRWAKADEVDLDEFASAPMIMRDPGANSRLVVDAALKRLGLSLAPPLAEIGSTTAAKATARSEHAPVLLSLLAMKGRGQALVVRRVAGVRFVRHFVVLHGDEKNLPAAARDLVRHLLQSARRQA